MRQVEKYICEICGVEVSASNYSKHIRRHEQHPETFEKSKYALNHEGLDCQFCGATCKNRNSLCNHERQCLLNPNRQHGVGFTAFNAARKAGEIITWNKGLTKDTDARLAEASKKLKGKPSYNRTTETKALISEKIKLAYAEGRLGTRLHRVKHDRNYYGTYKGFECDSSYELAFVIYNIDHNIIFDRNLTSFEYNYENQLHKYFPDFVLADGTFIEVKGRITDKDLAKWQDFPADKSLKILDREAIKPYLDYCISTYGKDFIKLYDQDKPSWLTRI